jgi:hypothetical protein
MNIELLDGILISLKPYDRLKLPHRFLTLLTMFTQTMETLPMILMTFETEIHMQLANCLFQMCI